MPTISTVSPSEVSKLVSEGKIAFEDILDVRTPLERSEVHISGTRHVPLDSLDVDSSGADPTKTLYLLCRSGARAQKAGDLLTSGGIKNLSVIDGGILAWEEAGLAVTKGKKVVSLDRQVRIAAGALVVAGTLLGFLVSPGWLALSGFVGAGLMFSGITDSCTMGLLISKLPWNR